MYYFVRVNGDTRHNNPGAPGCYVAGEPPQYPQVSFNYLGFCFERNIVRIGWPDTGDLRAASRTAALANCYSVSTVKPHVQKYLQHFSAMQVDSIVLVPNKDQSGEVYICEVVEPYHYFHNVPRDPYESAHRVGVRWDRDENNRPICYPASSLGIRTQGGFWLRAFHVLDDSASGTAAIPLIRAARKSR